MKRKIKKIHIQVEPKIIGKSRRGYPIYDQNPFLRDFEVTVKEKIMTISRGEELFNENDRHLGPGIVAKFIPVDKEHFTKIYAKKMVGYFDLSRAGYHLLLLICDVLPEKLGQDRIIFTYQDANRRSKKIQGKGISKATYNRGIKELIDKQFIAEAGPSGVFYINPNLIFAGDRVTFAEVYCSGSEFENVKKKILQKLKTSSFTDSFPIPEQDSKS